MFRPHYDQHLINTLLGRNNRKITEEDCYMLDRPYMNTVDLEILPRLASGTRTSSPKSNRFDTDDVYLPDRNANGIAPAGLTDMIDTEALLRLKWMDNSPRMSRLRETRRRRLVNKLEQYELWDQEQEQKNRQHELAREQRYKNIMDRLKSQDFCVNQMKKRHENELETTRELENYSNDHLYFDCLDDPKTFYKGPVSQYRQFSLLSLRLRDYFIDYCKLIKSEMEEKVKSLQNDLDTLNPRQKINQAILPRIERTREIYSQEPEIFTRSGRRVLKRPNLDRHSVLGGGRHGSESRRSTSGDADRSIITAGSASEKFLTESQRRLRNILSDSTPKPVKQLKPIIHSTDDAARNLGKMRLADADLSDNTGSDSTAFGLSDKKAVYFNDNVDYRSPPTINDE